MTSEEDIIIIFNIGACIAVIQFCFADKMVRGKGMCRFFSVAVAVFFVTQKVKSLYAGPFGKHVMSRPRKSMT